MAAARQSIAAGSAGGPGRHPIQSAETARPAPIASGNVRGPTRS